LALAVAQSRRQAEGLNSVAHPDSPDQPSKPIVGCTSHPRRAAQLDFDVAQSTVAKYMPTWATIAGMEDLPSQSRA
jgi:hypothetical protein